MCLSIPRTVYTVSRSTTTLLEAEDGLDSASDTAAGSEFVWASLDDPAEDDAPDLRERVQALEAELSRVRDQRDRLAAKADRVDELERQVERLKNEKRTLIQARKESPQLVPRDETAPSDRQRRRDGRLWTYLKRRFF